jgi:hypothetical protein
MSHQIAYHPNPEINAQIEKDTLAAEIADLNAGYPPRRWICLCGASHQRGHFMTVGVHRCLKCGYMGEGGVMVDPLEPGRMSASRVAHPEE